MGQHLLSGLSAGLYCTICSFSSTQDYLRLTWLSCWILSPQVIPHSIMTPVSEQANTQLYRSIQTESMTLSMGSSPTSVTSFLNGRFLQVIATYISTTHITTNTTVLDFLSHKMNSSAYSQVQAMHREIRANMWMSMRQIRRMRFQGWKCWEWARQQAKRKTSEVRVVSCRVPRIISLRNIGRRGYIVQLFQQQGERYIRAIIIRYTQFETRVFQVCSDCNIQIGLRVMDKLINIARKMEEQEASASKIAKTIVNSYKIMDKQRDELKGIQQRKIYRQQIPISGPNSKTGLNNTSNSSFSKQPSEKGSKIRKVEAPSAQKKIPIFQQPPSGKLVRPTSSREVPKQSTNPNKPKTVALRFKDEDKEFQIFSLKLLFEKMNKLRLLMGRFHSKMAFGTLKKYYKSLTQREDAFILKRAKRLMAKYFHLFRKETIIMKLEKENEVMKKELEREKINEEKAIDYHEFLLYQKAMRSWKRYIRLVHNQKKKAQEQAELARKPESIQPPVSQLKSKVLDFLQNIKQDIEQRNRPAPPVAQQVIQQEQIEASQSHMDLESHLHSDQEEAPHIVNAQRTQIQRVDQPEANHIPGRKLTHEELLKRREQLEKKNKERKQRLQKIKKEKQQQKLKMEQQRKLCEQKMKQEQAKRKQEEYQKFIKRKKDEQLAKQKQKQQAIRLEKLHEYAEQLDKLRLIRHYGIIPWKKLLLDRNRRFQKLAEKIQKAQLKLYWVKFLDKYDLYNEALEKKQKTQEQRAVKLLRKKCKVNIMRVLKSYMNEVQEEKLQLRSRHCVIICNITFKAWLRAMDVIRLQNYQAQKIQTEKVHLFRNAYLLKACFRAIARNKEEEKRERNVNQHKNNLKNKLLQWVKQQSDVNLDKLLQ